MAAKYKSFLTRIFLLTNVAAALVFLVATIAPYLNPAQWWVLSFAGLGFVIVFVLLILFLLFWIIVHPRYALISGITLLIGWKAISVLLPSSRRDGSTTKSRSRH